MEKNNDIEFMMDYVTKNMLDILVNERGMSVEEAFDILFNSELFEKLSDPASGLYFQNPRYVLSYLDKELKTGKLGD